MKFDFVTIESKFDRSRVTRLSHPFKFDDFENDAD